MADKAISELVKATMVNPGDKFVLEQDGTAKQLDGQTLENWLLSMADGHGGIHAIDLVGSVGLEDTYRITMADTSTYDFTVTNGNGIVSISYIGSEGLVDTYEIRYKAGEPFRYTIRNGEKGDKGDNAYTHYKWASQMPTEESHSMGDVPDECQGVYNGPSAEPPTDWKAYKWYKIKGEKGDTGDPAHLLSSVTEYQESTSGKVPPSGVWAADVPDVPQGHFLWTRTTTKWNSGSPEIRYSVARFGIDGKGAVAAVCGVAPDPDGNVALSANDLKALSINGGTMQGDVNMDGHAITGLQDPQEDGAPVTKGYGDRTYLKMVKFSADLNTVWEAAPDGGYMQSAAVPGILETDVPQYSVDLSGLTFAETQAAIDAFSEVYRLVTADGTVTVYSCRELTTALRIHMEVFR